MCEENPAGQAAVMSAYPAGAPAAGKKKSAGQRAIAWRPETGLLPAALPQGFFEVERQPRRCGSWLERRRSPARFLLFFPLDLDRSFLDREAKKATQHFCPLFCAESEPSGVNILRVFHWQRVTFCRPASSSRVNRTAGSPGDTKNGRRLRATECLPCFSKLGSRE